MHIFSSVGPGAYCPHAITSCGHSGEYKGGSLNWERGWGGSTGEGVAVGGAKQEADPPGEGAGGGHLSRPARG